MINILFSAGGLLGGIGLLLSATTAWPMYQFPRWSTALLAFSGIMHMAKAMVELTTGADLGPLALLANILIIVGLFGLAIVFWHEPQGRAHLAA